MQTTAQNQALLDYARPFTEKYPIWANRANPHEVYAQMRRDQPICPLIGPVSGNVFWFFTRYDDCIAAFKDPRIGKELHKHLAPGEKHPFGENDPNFDAINRHLLNLDPPDHTRLRALVHKAFTPALVENLRGRIQTIADDLIDAALAKNTGEMDLIADYGFPLPITVIAEMLGIPAEDRDRFREWTKAILFGRDQEDARIKVFEFVGYMNEMIDQHIAQPKEDLLTALLGAEEAGDKLDRMELMSMIFLLLVAGHETTVNLIGNGMYTLFTHPDQLAMLRANPHLMKNAVEEMLRFEGPVEVATTRFTLDEVTINGTTIPKGYPVMISMLSADRDDSYFANPNVFDITREPNRHIAFGNGIHFCVGAPLARLEGSIAMGTLLKRLPELRANEDSIAGIKWSDNLLIRSIQTPLKVRF